MSDINLLELYKDNSFNCSTEEDILLYYSSVTDDLVLLYSIELSTRLGINPSISHTIIDKKSAEHLLAISEANALYSILKVKGFSLGAVITDILNSDNPFTVYIDLLNSINLPIKRKIVDSVLRKDVRAKIRLEHDLPLLSSVTGRTRTLNIAGLSVVYEKLLHSYIMASTKSCFAFYESLKVMIRLMYPNYNKIKEFNKFLDDNCDIRSVKSPDSTQYDLLKHNVLNRLSSLLQLGDTIEPEEGLYSILDVLVNMYDTLNEQLYKNISEESDPVVLNILKSMEDCEFKDSLDFSKYNRRRDAVILEYNKMFRDK